MLLSHFFHLQKQLHAVTLFPMLERLITCFQTVLACVLVVSIVLNPARSIKSLFRPKNGLFLMFGSFKHIPHTFFYRLS